MTKILETEEAGIGLYIVAADKDRRLGLSARIHGVQNAACFVCVCVCVCVCSPHRATADFQGASKHMASFGQNGKM